MGTKKKPYISGQKVRQLIFIEEREPYALPSGKFKRAALFQCACGNEFVAIIENVSSEKSTRCATCKNRHIAEGKIKHGCSIGGKKSDEYIVWASMMNRCYNPNNHAYADYGGRGIKVSDSWQSFENFIADMGNRPTSKHTLERIRNDKGYGKTNCKWATKKEQANNRRSTTKVMYGE